jgi:FkbM family methyltransferase
MIGFIRSTARRLEGARPNPLLGPLATIVYSLASRRLRLFSVDRSGRWVNRQGSNAIVSPTIHTLEHGALEQTDLDHWAHGYRPKRGDVIVDVGAGIGEELIPFSKLVGPEGRIVAIEAHPLTFDCLRETVRRSRLDNVELVHCAVAGEVGEVSISDSSDHLGNSVVGVSDGVAVPARTLDSLTEELGLERIDLLKMNIEGAEKPALAGMGRMIGKVRHAVISCHDFLADRNGSDELRTCAAVAAFLSEHGFALERRLDDPRDWVPYYLYATRQARGERVTRASGPSPSTARAA